MIDSQELETVANIARAMIGKHRREITSVTGGDVDQSNTWKLGQELLADVKHGKPLEITVDRLELLARFSTWITLSPDLGEQDPKLICSQLSDGDRFVRMLQHLLAQQSKHGVAVSNH